MPVGSCINICDKKLTQIQRRQVYVCCQLRLSLQSVRKVKIPAILLQQFQSIKAKVHRYKTTMPRRFPSFRKNKKTDDSTYSGESIIVEHGGNRSLALQVRSIPCFVSIAPENFSQLSCVF